MFRIKRSFIRKFILMLKGVFLFILIFFLSSKSFAAGSYSNDSLEYNLQLKDHELREKKLVSYIKDYFGIVSVDSFVIVKKALHRDLLKYDIGSSGAYELYAESIFHNRLLHTD